MVQQVGAEEEGVKITSELLKSITGEFDLESILFLKLTKIDICNLGCIGDCVNLERLDLSRNDISNLKPLASLKLLTVLNLSANRISNIDPLHFCENLQSLNLAGNLISSADVLCSITELKKLDTIRLKDAVSGFSNPGERVMGKGSDLYRLCKDIDSSLKGPHKATPQRHLTSGQSWTHQKHRRLASSKNVIDSSAPLNVPLGPKKWVEDNYWELQPVQHTRTAEATERFYELLNECRKLNSKAADVVTKTKRTLRTMN